ncbi:MAG: hypothetical protein WD431_08450 [Cyclobacteriaceae bacterium]
MDKIAYKKQVMEAARKRQKEIVDDFRTRIDEMREGEKSSNNENFEYDQQGQEDENAIIINRMADELNFVVEELDFLNQMKTDQNLFEEVTLGAIVKTDQMTFFPSVSIEYFEVEGKQLFGISRNAPLYKEMKTKKKGDGFSFNGEKYKIVDVF